MASPVRRVLIYSIKAGAGHMRAAEAIATVLAETAPDTEVKNIEALTLTNSAFRRSFTATYNKLATDLPSIWGYIYGTMERKSVGSRVKRLTTLFDRANSTGILETAQEFDPDAIVCTHYFPAEILAAHRRKGKLRATLHVTLTDYDIHTMWIQPGVDHYYVATDEMAFALREKGVGDAEVHVTGIPLMPAFSQKYPPRATLRRRLGLREDAVTVLASAGGFGLGGVDETVAGLASTSERIQILAIAGRNAELEASLRAVAANHPGRVVPFGFVTNMHELMAASDFAVTKPGGLTSSECMALGVPMVIIQPIPGQEERNADYLLENGVALRANSDAHLTWKVRTLLEDDARRAAMAAAARRTARPRAAYDVAAQILAG